MSSMGLLSVVARFILDIAAIFGLLWAITTVWNGYAVPLGFIPLTYMHAYGLLVLIGLFFLNAFIAIGVTADSMKKEMNLSEKDKEWSDWSKTLARLFLPLISVGTLWVVERIFG